MEKSNITWENFKKSPFETTLLFFLTLVIGGAAMAVGFVIIVLIALVIVGVVLWALKHTFLLLAEMIDIITYLL